MKINLSEIRIDGGTQSRVEINQQVVEDYAEAISVGIRFPDVSVFFDDTTYWLVDGFHRYRAHLLAGKTSINAESKKGTQREAVLYAVGANAEHGLRRSNEDKRKAVRTLLNDAEWSLWSSVRIAEACAVSHTFVDRLRHEWPPATVASEKPRTYTTKHGTEAVMNTAQIGRAPESAKPKAPPKVESEGNPHPYEHEDDPEIDALIAREKEEVERGMAKLAEILAGDDALSVMTKKCADLTTMNAVLNSRIVGLQNEVQARTQDAKSWMRKAKALEKRAK